MESPGKQIAVDRNMFLGPILRSKILYLVASLVLSRQCVGHSKGFANQENSHQIIGGSLPNSDVLANAKEDQQYIEDSGSGQGLGLVEEPLEVVEV